MSLGCSGNGGSGGHGSRQNGGVPGRVVRMSLPELDDGEDEDVDEDEADGTR